MSQPSLRKREIRKNSRGISSIIATVFMVIIILFISFNVFTFTVFKNTQFQDAVDELNQMDQDSFSERLVASNGNFTVTQPNSTVQVRVTLSNEGHLSAEAIRMWVVWKDGDFESYGHEDLSIKLSPGDTVVKSIWVTVPGVQTSGTFGGWLVTARGNLVPIEKRKVITAQVSEGIGSIKMDFNSFRYYYWHINNTITPWDEGIGNFTVPLTDVVFRIVIGNLDADGREIVLHSTSLMHIYSHKSASPAVARIVNVEDGELLTPFERITLPYGETRDIFFAIKAKDLQSVKESACAVNLILLGTIAEQDYGQNIPFVSVYVTG